MTHQKAIPKCPGKGGKGLLLCGEEMLLDRALVLHPRRSNGPVQFSLRRLSAL